MLAGLYLVAALATSNGRAAAAPAYTAASIANSATNEPGAIAPNTLVTIYGADLAYDTHAVSPQDLHDDTLPVNFANVGVRVTVGRVPAFLYFVSPGQINILVPSSLRPGKVKVQVVRQGIAGPDVEVDLLDAAPGLFQAGGLVVACHPDGNPVTAEAPAAPGEIVVLYATGLGPTRVPVADGRLLTPPLPAGIGAAALTIQRLPELKVLLGGAELAHDRILYAGLTPGYAGLYQVNIRLPDELFGDNPEVRLAIGDHISPEGVHLATSTERVTSK